MPIDLAGPEVQAAIERMAQADATGAAPTADGIGPWPYLALIGGNGADLITTLQAIKSGRGRESNPMLKSLGPGGIAAAKVGSAAVLALLMRVLTEKQHPGFAKLIGYGDGAVTGAIAARNARVGR